jgi:hypothetical protein
MDPTCPTCGLDVNDPLCPDPCHAMVSNDRPDSIEHKTLERVKKAERDLAALRAAVEWLSVEDEAFNEWTEILESCGLDSATALLRAHEESRR